MAKKTHETIPVVDLKARWHEPNLLSDPALINIRDLALRMVEATEVYRGCGQDLILKRAVEEALRFHQTMRFGTEEEKKEALKEV